MPTPETDPNESVTVSGADMALLAHEAGRIERLAAMMSVPSADEKLPPNCVITLIHNTSKQDKKFGVQCGVKRSWYFGETLAEAIDAAIAANTPAAGQKESTS